MGWFKKKNKEVEESHGTMPKGYKPPKREKNKPVEKRNYVERTHYSEYTPPRETPSYSSDYNTARDYRPAGRISDVITLLEGLRTKHRKEALMASHSLSQKHRSTSER